ncbi:hypothetical protein WJX72_001780 [[Myrmecia] bisecta]|uniref:S5 DRBM domain-containing protein n=1 Tax=[Myrmecia] bisecta TaxID=41462 RepID=A0AAW1Q6K4_9CHLO
MAYELLCSFGRKLKRKCNKLAYMIETGSSAGYEHAAWANTKSKAAAANLRAQQSLFLLPAASDAYILQVVVQRWQAFHLADAKELREHVQALHKAIHTRGAVRRCKLGARLDPLAQGQIAVHEAGAAGSPGGLLDEIEGASRKRQMFLLNQLLRTSNAAYLPPAAEDSLNPFPDVDQKDAFKLKVVEINRTSKGTKAGRIASISATVIVGNGQGVLGIGTGKSLEVMPALKKAVERAQKDIVVVPTRRVSGVHTAKYGKVKVTLYPRRIGEGLMANELISEMCRLAGLRDIGIKVHGSRNRRNMVMAVFEVFGKVNMVQAQQRAVDSAKAAQRGVGLSA